MEAWQRYDMHRYLDPATGRFLTRYPIGMEGGINLYATVGNGVVMGEDSEGRVFIGIVLPDFGFILWMDDILVAVKKCGECVREAYELALRVLDWSRNDKLAHCYATCEITRCSGSPACAIGAGECREQAQGFGHRVYPGGYPEGASDADRLANSSGVACAKAREGCLACCLRKWGKHR